MGSLSETGVKKGILPPGAEDLREFLTRPASRPMLDLILVAIGAGLLVPVLLFTLFQSQPSTNQIAGIGVAGVGTALIVGGLYYGVRTQSLMWLLAWSMNIQMGLELLALVSENDGDAELFRNSADRIQEASQVMLNASARGVR